MASNEYFTSEQIDEQIDQLRPQSTLHGQADEAQLVEMLQCHYRVSLVAEDRASLARAQQRILDELNHTHILGHEPQFVNVSRARPVAHPRRAGFMRLLSGLAAVLVVGLLLGGWLVVARMAKPHTSTTSISVRPSSLYTIHSGIVYRLEGSTGKVIWQHPASTKKPSDPNHGGSAQVQVVNSIVYAVFDFDIYAFEASNGHQIWHVTNQSKTAYFYSVVDNERLYLFSLDNTFSALDAISGAQLWHNTAFTTQNGYGFSVRDGNLYTETSDPTPENQKLFVLDGATGKVRWSYPLLDGSLYAPPLVAHGVVYFSSGNRLLAVKEQNGDTIWERQIPTVGSFENLYIVGDVLYLNGGTGITLLDFRSINSAIYALEAQNGHILWQSAPDFHAFSLPMTSNRILAWRQHNGSYSIAGLDPRTGKAVWQVPFACNAVTRNVEAPQVLNPSCGVSWTEIIDGEWSLLESDSQIQTHNSSQGPQIEYTIKSFDPQTGHLVFEHPLLGSGLNNLGVVGVSNGLLYAAIGVPRVANTIPYDDTIFVAYHLNDGTPAWHYTMPLLPAPQGANTSPNTSGTVLFP